MTDRALMWAGFVLSALAHAAAPDWRTSFAIFAAQVGVLALVYGARVR